MADSAPANNTAHTREGDDGDAHLETIDQPLRHGDELQKRDDDHDGGGDDDDGEDGDFEFSFFCRGGEPHSPISADDIFHNGQIRPLFQFVVPDSSHTNDDCGCCGQDVRSPIKKVFIERSDLPATFSTHPSPDGLYCGWSSAKEDADHAASRSVPEICKKSNSTGFSKLFRFHEILLRSNSDGKDAFVFLSSHHKREDKHETASSSSRTTHRENIAVSAKETRSSSVATAAATGAVRPNTAALGDAAAAPTTEKKQKKKKGSETKTTSYLAQYVRKKGEVGGDVRRKSYLPYRQDLVGFFTNVNGMSRNVHPY